MLIMKKWLYLALASLLALVLAREVARMAALMLAVHASAAITLAVAAPLGIHIGQCSESAAKWSWDAKTHSISPAKNVGGDGTALAAGCLTATGLHTQYSTGYVLLQPCNVSDPNQRWASSQGTVELVGSPGLGWVSDRNTNPGEPVWLYDLRPGGPTNITYCTQHHNCAFNWGGGLFKNPAGNCVVLGTEGPPAPPPLPPPPPPGPSMPTCAAGSPVEHEQFCDPALSFEARAKVRQLCRPVCFTCNIHSARKI